MTVAVVIAAELFQESIDMLGSLHSNSNNFSFVAVIRTIHNHHRHDLHHHTITAAILFSSPVNSVQVRSVAPQQHTSFFIDEGVCISSAEARKSKGCHEAHEEDPQREECEAA